MMYLIIDLEEEELKSICNSKEDVIGFAQEYYDYLEFEDDDKRPKDWNMALDFLEANSRYVLDLDKREDYKKNRLIEEILELEGIADEADNDYALEDMADCVNENLMSELREMLRDELLDIIGDLNINTLVGIRNRFKDICINYGIREEGEIK